MREPLPADFTKILSAFAVARVDFIVVGGGREKDHRVIPDLIVALEERKKGPF